jgi:hypothetical protein
MKTKLKNVHLIRKTNKDRIETNKQTDRQIVVTKHRLYYENKTLKCPFNKKNKPRFDRNNRTNEH